MSRFLVGATWDDNAPYLTPQARTDLERSIPKYQKAARTQGIPQLGAGLIFPIEDDELLVDPFPIPKHFRRGYGLDVGWNRTAAIFGAQDPDTKVKYLVDEYYGAEESPTIHAASIRRRGLWIPGRIDPAARGRTQDDGKRLLTLYRKEVYGHEDVAAGVKMLGVANNAVETGLYDMLMAMQQGMLKVFRHRCPNWMAERRLYRRDEKGRVVKKFDHAMDASRYFSCSGDSWLEPEPGPTPSSDPMLDRFTRGGRGGNALAWMGQ